MPTHHRPRVLVTRRQLLWSLTGVAVLAACDGAATGASRAPTTTLQASSTSVATSIPPTTATTAAPTTTPAVQPTLRVAGDAVPNLDPIKWAEPAIQRMYRPAVESLFDLEPDGSLSPVLASEPPEVSRDRLAVRISLRTDVAFHDGTPFDSAAVVASFRSALEPANASQWLVRLGVAVDRVEASGPEQVTFRLARPFQPFLTMLGRIPIVPAEPLYEPQSTYARSLVGTGPYAFESWEGDTLAYRAFEGYHRGAPQLPRLEFVTVADPVSALAEGTVDLLPGADPSDGEAIEAAGGRIVTAEGSTIRVVALANLDPARPTSDLRVRRALAMAVDRTSLVATAFAGDGEPLTSLLAPGTTGAASLPDTGIGATPDLETARRELAEAGVLPDEPLAVIAPEGATGPLAAQTVAAGLTAMGLEARIEVLSPAELAERLALTQPDVFGDYDLAVVATHTQPTSGFGPDYAYFGLRSGLPTNLNKVSDDEMDALLERAVAAAEGDEQNAAWRAVQSHDLASGLYQIPLASGRYREAIARTLAGYVPSPMGTIDPTAAAIIG